jgi:peptidoglycan hydrolase-like protein with peptidoglycan-binding domain
MGRTNFTVRFGFTKQLSLGDNDAQVKFLEQRLKNLGYFSGTPDTQFNVITKPAVLLYQHSQHIAETGMADFLTRHTLNTATTQPNDSVIDPTEEDLFYN